jgi:hypothetical protein
MEVGGGINGVEMSVIILKKAHQYLIECLVFMIGG